MEVGAGRIISQEGKPVEKQTVSSKGRVFKTKTAHPFIYLFSQDILNGSNSIFATFILAQPNFFSPWAPLWEQPSHLSLTTISPPHSPSREITGRNRWDEARSSAEIWTYTLHKTGKVAAEIVMKAGIQLSAGCQTMRLGQGCGIFFLSWQTSKIELRAEAIVCSFKQNTLGKRQNGGKFSLLCPCRRVLAVAEGVRGSWLMIRGIETHAHTKASKYFGGSIHHTLFCATLPEL